MDANVPSPSPGSRAARRRSGRSCGLAREGEARVALIHCARLLVRHGPADSALPRREASLVVLETAVRKLNPPLLGKGLAQGCVVEGPVPVWALMGWVATAAHFALQVVLHAVRSGQREPE